MAGRSLDRVSCRATATLPHPQRPHSSFPLPSVPLPNPNGRYHPARLRPTTTPREVVGANALSPPRPPMTSARGWGWKEGWGLEGTGYGMEMGTESEFGKHRSSSGFQPIKNTVFSLLTVFPLSETSRSPPPFCAHTTTHPHPLPCRPASDLAPRSGRHCGLCCRARRPTARLPAVQRLTRRECYLLGVRSELTGKAIHHTKVR